MISDLTGLDLFPTTAFEVLVNLSLALFCGLIISFVYRITYKGPNYSISLVNALVLLTIITSIILLVIGNNLARAFGLVGAMSIIRFRTAVRDVQDIVFIFLALAIGMAAGVGYAMIAITGTIFISIVIILLTLLNWGQTRKREYLLQVSYNATNEIEAFIPSILKNYCKNFRLINLKNVGSDNELEAYYHVVLKDVGKSNKLIKELNSRSEIFSVNLYFDEDDINAPT